MLNIENKRDNKKKETLENNEPYKKYTLGRKVCY